VTTRKQVYALAKKLGVEVVETRARGLLEVEMLAPRGKKFCCSDAHSAVTEQGDHETPAARFWEMAFGDLSSGLRECDDGAECEWCTEE